MNGETRRTNRQRLKELLLLVSVLAIIGVVVLVSGVVPIKASSRHWAVTRWFLDFASDRSISTHSKTLTVSDLPADASVTLGAATYESHCQWCHGSPGFPMPLPAAKMTPPPPDLSQAVDDWQDAELFYILKHGIKFAGMPAWPSRQRDDGIWHVVAFLRALPEMNASEFHALVSPESDVTSAASRLAGELCAACHGLRGEGRAGSEVPRLASQSKEYMAASLKAYREGGRHSGIMQPIAMRLSDEEISMLADYFAQQSLPAKQARPDAGDHETLVAEGRELSEDGSRTLKIASCVDCHGPGKDPDKAYPRLAGQPATYVTGQLTAFRKRVRGGGVDAKLMHPIVDRLSDSQIEALSAYYASLDLEEAPDSEQATHRDGRGNEDRQ